GPVVCVYAYDELDAALAAANVHPHAFQAAIYTRELEDMLRAFEVFAASAVMVNDHSAFRDDVMPFAGLNASGLGIGGIPYTIEDMQFEKMLVIKH
ncbi:MAG: aldehyde dehydrogenase family protein, partial [Xanthomonadales bacterium]|nr:aldehyde dehydrogenase family protein [Xanthomonadales bacterium]